MDILTINDEVGKYPNSYYAGATTLPDSYSQAEGEISTDVCVVGGGFSGLSAALHLARQGMKVVLLEANRLGSGASGRNGGQVGTGQRVEQIELEKKVGMEQAQTLWDMSLESVQLVKDLISESDADCKFVNGIIHANHRQRYTKETEHFIEHMSRVYGYDQFRFLDETAIKEEIGSPDYHSGCLDLGSGHINPLLYVFALVKLVENAGVTIYEQSRMTQYTKGDEVKIQTDKAVIKAKYAVFGLNGYHNNIDPSLVSNVMPINNFICATEPLSDDMAQSLIRNNYGVADSRFVINYFRLSEDNRLLFGGGESYGYKFPADIKAKTRKPMLEIFPDLKDTRIDYAWGGTLGITMSRLPHFERVDNNILSVAGFSGHGVAMATLAGKMAAETISTQATTFDFMAQLPSATFPGGVLLRQPLLVSAMLWYSMLDKL